MVTVYTLKYTQVSEAYKYDYKPSLAQQSQISLQALQKTDGHQANRDGTCDPLDVLGYQTLSTPVNMIHDLEDDSSCNLTTPA